MIPIKPADDRSVMALVIFGLFTTIMTFAWTFYRIVPFGNDATIIKSWTMMDSGKTVEIFSNSDVARFGKKLASWRDQGVIEVSTRVPVERLSHPGLYIDGVDERFEVLQDGETVYDFGMRLPDGDIPGVKVHIISLREKAGGVGTKDGMSEITIRMRSFSNLIGFYGVQAYGSVDSLRVFSLRLHFGQVAVAVICLFTFISFLGASFWQSEERGAYLLYSSLCLVAGAYFFGQSRFGTVIFDQPQIALLANRNFVVLLNLVVLAFFEYYVVPHSRRWIRLTLAGLLLMQVVTIIACSIDQRMINLIFRTQQYVCLMVQVYVLVAAMLLAARNEVAEHKGLLVGIGIAIITGFYDVLLSIGWITGNGIGIGHWGGLAVIVSFGYLIASRVRANQIALDMFTHNLQDKVAERTHELQRVVQSLEKEMDARSKLEVLASNSARQAAVADLSRGLAHEINNPLTILNGYAHVIQAAMGRQGESPQNALVIKSTSEILKMSERITRVVRGLMEFSEGDQGSGFEIIRALDLAESLNIIVTPLIKSNDVYFEILFMSDTTRETQVRCRVIQIKQILVNLISNAIDAYEAKSSEKRVDLVIEEVDQHLLFTVADRGGGIPKEIQKRIFEPFVTTKANTKGTGLGLSVAHGLARGNGGQLTYITKTAQESVNHGTKFTLSLPVHRQNQKIA